MTRHVFKLSDTTAEGMAKFLREWNETLNPTDWRLKETLADPYRADVERISRAGQVGPLWVSLHIDLFDGCCAFQILSEPTDPNWSGVAHAPTAFIRQNIDNPHVDPYRRMIVEYYTCKDFKSMSHRISSVLRYSVSGSGYVIGDVARGDRILSRWVRAFLPRRYFTLEKLAGVTNPNTGNPVGLWYARHNIRDKIELSDISDLPQLLPPPPKPVEKETAMNAASPLFGVL